MANRQRKSSGSLKFGIVGLVFMLIMLWLAFQAVTGVFKILSIMAIPFFIIALILNYRVVSDYANWVFGLIRKDTTKGLLVAAGSVIGYPLVSAWLAFKAYTTRNKIREQKGNPKKGEYVKYEEVDEVDDEDFLELDDLDDTPTRQKQAQPRAQSRDNDYDNLFE